MTLRRSGIALALALGLSLSGCRSLPTPVALPEGDPRPQGLLESFSQSAHRRQGLRGRARLEVESDARDLHLRAGLVLVIERPARLRVEVLGLLGQSLAVLTSDGESFEWFDARDHAYERGAVHDELLWERIRVPLRVREVVGLVLGESLPPPGLAVSGAQAVGDDEIRVDLSDDRGVLRERIAFDAAARLRAGEIFGHPGALARRSRFDDYGEQDGIAFAREISVEFPDLELRAALALSDVELNPAVAPGLFRLRTARARGGEPEAGR